MTEAAVRKQVAGHCDFFIDGMQDQPEEAVQEARDGVAVIDDIQDQAEDAPEAEEGATASTSEIEIVDAAQLYDHDQVKSISLLTNHSTTFSFTMPVFSHISYLLQSTASAHSTGIRR